MQERTRNALKDNKIYKSEKKELDKLAEEVNLSDEDIGILRALINQLRINQQIQ